MMLTITRYLDLVGQQLTSAPMWIQVIAVLGGTVPLCLFLAFALLRAIDIAGARTYRLFNGQELLRRPTVHRGREVREGAAQRNRPAGVRPGGSRIVVNEEPR